MLNPLRLALRKLSIEPVAKPKSADGLEVAMREFDEAKSPGDKARAFKAALKLAQSNSGDE